MTGPPAPWGAPPPWGQPPWGQPPCGQPAWGPPPPPLPPVVPARYVPGDRRRGTDGEPPGPWLERVVSVVAALVLVAGLVVALVLAVS